MTGNDPRPDASARDKFSERFNLSRIAIQNPAITLYLLVVLLIAGTAAYFGLGQDEDPPFTIRVMVVRAFWPGATAMQMAQQVSDPIDKTLQEVPYVDRIRSYSKPGETTFLLELKDYTPPGEVPEIWYTVRKKVGDMKSRLPAGVQGPVFNDEFGDVYGVIYALNGEGFSRAEMRDQADFVRQQLLQVHNVAKVELLGVQEEKVYVEISQRKLARLGIDFRQVIQALNDQNAVAFAGELQMESENLQVRIGGQFDNLETLRALPLRFNDRTFRLGDLGTIERGYQDPPAPKVHFNGREVVALAISMAKGGDIIQLGKDLKAATGDLRARLPAGVELEQMQDQPAAVAVSVQEFLRVLAEALIIVLAVSFLSLGLHRHPWRIDTRPGLVVALSIPTVLAATFLVMNWAGIDLHKISLGSLIIALGLLVDDAIIIIEMTVRKMEEGLDRLKASTYAFTATAMPMLTGTLITAAGFLPIGLANSATGEYTFAIFAVTTAALLISWFVSIYFVPFLGYKLLRDQPASHGEVFDTPFYRRVRSLVEKCVERRWLTIAATVGALGIGIAGMQLVEKQFFPDSSRPEILVDLWLPEGSSFAASEAAARRVEARLGKVEGVSTVATFIGSGVPHFYLPLEQIFPQDNVSQLIVLPASHEDRERIRRDLPRLLSQEFPDIRTRVQLLPNGPPVTYPVMFRVMGPDPVQVRTLAESVKAQLRKDADMRGINDNWNEEIKVLKLDIDQARARALGVSSEGLATASETILSGLPIGQYRENNRQIGIVLRQPETERSSLTALSSAYLPTASGASIPFSQVGHAYLGWEPGVIWRQNGNFAITVQGDVRHGIQGATVALRLNRQLDALRAQMPAGYRIEIAGTVAESSKGTSSISANVPLMLFIIFTLLMLQLRSFSRSVLVFLTGPLGLIGASMTLLIIGKPMGFVAMLGIIAMNGMIIRNSVILIDQIEQDIAAGVDRWTAIVDAAVRRFRPIMLTAAAAVLAMIPLIRSAFWGPMAAAIMGGLIVATALTLLSLPAMYAAWFKVRRNETRAP
ncbi:MAG: multidrug transporter AcrB [Moraxellaceae bacterium]|jgi:multidrug efflux pump subunit AcrB|nr:multidrug transporter AcrB [Moraxellaceae bacterium]